MVGGSVLADGSAQIFLLGAGHSVAYVIGAGVLGAYLVRRTATSLWPAALGRMSLVSAAVGVGAWFVSRAVLDAGSPRLTNLAVVAVLGVVGGGLVFAGYQVLGVRASLSERTPVPPAGDAEVLV
jgi:hypothetical protein